MRPKWSLGSFGFVLFVWMRPEVRLVHSGGSALSDCALGVSGFARVRLVCAGAPCGLLVSFGLYWCIRVRAGGRLGSSHSSGYALGISEFVLVG